MFLLNVYRDSSSKLSLVPKQRREFVEIVVCIFNESEETNFMVIDSMDYKIPTKYRINDNADDYDLDVFGTAVDKTTFKGIYNILFENVSNLDNYLVISNEKGEKEVVFIENEWTGPYANFDKDSTIKWFIDKITYHDKNRRSGGYSNTIQSVFSKYPLAHYCKTIVYNLYENSSYILEGTIGLLGLYEMFFPRIFILFYLLFVVVLSILDANKGIIISSTEKIIFILICAGCVFLVSMAMMRGYGVEPDGRFYGVHGRYFIHVLPLVFTFFYTRLPLSGKICKVINPSLNQILMCFITFSLTVTCMVIIFRCYV